MTRPRPYTAHAYVGDDEVEVSGTYYPETHDTRVDPGTAAEVELDAITLCGLDVSDALTDEELESIEEQVLESMADEGADDWRDESYERESRSERALHRLWRAGGEPL